MEEIVTCSVETLVEHFGFVQVVGDDKSVKREIRVPNTNRPGLELAGFYHHAEPSRIVIIGNKETAYIKTLDPETKLERFEHITDGRTPLILVTGGNPVPSELLRIAKRKNFPVFTCDTPSSHIMVKIVTYLDEYLAPRDSIHGVLMNVFGKGVLIMGESGMGKSEVALELILRGHALVADDRVDIARVSEKLIGNAPELLRGMLEIRGIGVIDTTIMFGANAFLESKQIDFVVEFKQWNDNAEYQRVGLDEQAFFNALSIDIPHIVFPVKEGRNLSVLVESAVRDFMMKQRGVNSSKIFDQRVIDFIEKQSKK